MFTLVELCSWHRPQSELSDRRDRPWDNPNRRPSHADRRRTMARESLEKALFTVLGATPDAEKFRHWAETLLSLCLSS